MKFKRSWKSVLAAVLSVVLTLGAVAGMAPVKAWAADINLPAITLSPGQSTTIMVNADVSTYTIGSDFLNSTVTRAAFDGANTPITITVGAAEPPTAAGSWRLVEIYNGTDRYYFRVYISPTNGTDPSGKPGSTPNGDEDTILRTLPPTGPDGHQHDWHWEYGSTYHCSICNTFYTVYPAHDHQYEWYVTKPATETDDGEAHHMCKICGSVDLIEPVGAYYLFSQNAENKINKAPIGGTVNVETTRWLSFQGYVLDALAKRPDVTLNVTFRENGYKGGEVKTVTIPAGYDAASLKDANGYCGFKYLAGVFGAN